MSGSNGPDYSQSRTGTGGDDCSSYRRDKPLQAPNDEVVDGLRAGDILALELREGPPLVVAVLGAGADEAGSVIPDTALISCLRRGMKFSATVRSIRGGHLMLSVAPS